MYSQSDRRWSDDLITQDALRNGKGVETIHVFDLKVCMTFGRVVVKQTSAWFWKHIKQGCSGNKNKGTPWAPRLGNNATCTAASSCCSPRLRWRSGAWFSQHCIKISKGRMIVHSWGQHRSQAHQVLLFDNPVRVNAEIFSLQAFHLFHSELGQLPWVLSYVRNTNCSSTTNSADLFHSGIRASERASNSLNGAAAGQNPEGTPQQAWWHDRLDLQGMKSQCAAEGSDHGPASLFSRSG